LASQETALRAVAQARAEELEVSLAELEGCAGRLRNEAAELGDLRASLADSVPQLASEAVAPALAETAARAVAEVRSAVAELGAALAETVPAAVAQALGGQAGQGTPSPAAEVAPAEPGVPGVVGVAADTDLVTQLHEAQDEAAEWFTIVVDEAVRRAVERHLTPSVTPPPGVGAGGPDAGGASAEPAVDHQPGVDRAMPEAPVALPEPPTAEVPGDPRAPGVAPTEPGTPEGDDLVEAEAGVARAEPVSVGHDADTTPGTAPSEEEARAAVIISDRTAGDPGRAAQHPPVETLVAELGLAPAPEAGGPPAPAFAAPSTPNGNPSAIADTVAESQGAPAWDDDDEAEPGRESSVACVLPGVAVGPTLALGVSEALRRARLRRRRRRLAGAPRAGLHRHDPFAGDLSLRLERFALARRNLAFDADGVAPADGTTAMVVAAERDDREVVLDLAEGPVALVGPGAADAGRALVATFLAHCEPAAGVVLATGDALPAGPAFPGLERYEQLADALDVLEAELDRRQKLLADGGGRGPSERANGDGDEDRRGPFPVLLLATSAVPDDLSSRVAELLARGPGLGLTALGVGCELDGAVTVTLQPGALTRSVSPEGRAHDLWGARLFTLSAGATAEVLDLLSASRTDDGEATGEVEDQPFTVLSPVGGAAIQVRLLGTYRLEVDGTEIKSGLRAKARELLAFYLLHTEGTTLDMATEALWPEADTGRGSEWFWTALGNLRTTLRRATGTKELMIIERDGDRYRIEPVFDVDLWRFQAALPASGAADVSDPAWAAALETAADLYGGELLVDADWAWADVPREDLRRRAVDVLVALAAIRQRAGDVRAALDTLSRAVEVDPLAEQLYRRIMRLQANQSGPDEVAATFRRLQARLDDFDLEP
ncbi:MAG: hypothetical protein LC708_02165, partial [Actinobacteria bacterium]|nr:hypothetical protein [Actinomycetota bacterium]